MSRRKKLFDYTFRRGKDRSPRKMNPASLANLADPIPPVLDGSETFTTRIRLMPADARAWRKLDGAERRRLVELALQIRANGG